jgi:hypothetical protein
VSYQRKPIGSPCAGCGAPVASEPVAVRTLTRTLPYTPKIWHRPCFEAHRPAASPLPARAAEGRATCTARLPGATAVA